MVAGLTLRHRPDCPLVAGKDVVPATRDAEPVRLVLAMSDLLPFIVVGVGCGLGLRPGRAGPHADLQATTGVFNFAHGALAAAAAFVFFTMHVDWGWPWPLARGLAVIGVGRDRGPHRRAALPVALPIADAATAVVATVGLLLAVQGLIQWRYGTATRQLAPFLSGTAVHVGGVAVSRQQAAIGTGRPARPPAALLVFLRFSRLGACRCGPSSTNPTLLALAGTDPTRVRTVAWVIGSGVRRAERRPHRSVPRPRRRPCSPCSWCRRSAPWPSAGSPAFR